MCRRKDFKRFETFFSSNFTKIHIHVFTGMSGRKMSVIESSEITIDINNLIEVIDSCFTNLCI